MQTLNNLSDDADQLVTFVLPDGSILQLEFFYRAGIQRWTLDLTHDLLTLRGFNLTVGPNILRPWKNLISFGIAIISTTGLDPINSTDFLDGTVTVNMLSAAEVALVETDLLTPAPAEVSS